MQNPATTFTANNHNATKAFDPGIELSTSVVRPASDEMGCANSKSDDPDEEEQPSNNPANIHYDNDGNLRHGGNVHDRDDELHKILASDDAIEEATLRIYSHRNML